MPRQYQRAVVPLPEQRMGDALALHPLPVLRAPPRRVAVAAGVDELQEPLVGHVVALDRERRRPRR